MLFNPCIVKKILSNYYHFMDLEIVEMEKKKRKTYFTITEYFMPEFSLMEIVVSKPLYH